MRIIAGSAKRQVLRSLRGRVLRPTADRVREALFSMLGERVVDARFLDLYAGVGTVGLEALSRGASEAVFVESHRPAARLIAENARRCRLESGARVIALPVARALARLAGNGEVFDLVFLDPPYDTGEAPAAMQELAAHPSLVGEQGLVICQHSRHEQLAEEIGDFRRMRQSRFGETMLDCCCLGGRAVESGSICGDL